MPQPPPTDPRILILLNPGRQSRHYLLGLAAGAARAGIPCLTLELGPIWQAASGADPEGAKAAVRRKIAELARARRITHAIGYVFNGTHDLGLTRDGDGPARTVWDDAGVRHILLWTDHPEWAMKGCSLDEPLCGMLGGANRVHILKSDAAASEAANVLGWPNVRSMPMAEDYGAMRREAGAEPMHDAVAIVGDAAAPPTDTLRFLDANDPDPGVVDAAMRPHAERAWLKVVGGEHAALMHAWLDARQASPGAAFCRLAGSLEPVHDGSLAWLRAEPRRWYGAVQALRRMVGWRRNFWLAWIGRRVNLGLYGSPAAAMGIPQTEEAAGWVGYEQQAAVYARGCVAININAAHDEEGLTHKPFQIAASGVACIHYASEGLESCFEVGREVLTFRRGAELLEEIRELAGDAARRVALADAMRRRAMADHTWEQRLRSMLTAEEAGKADVRVSAAAAA